MTTRTGEWCDFGDLPASQCACEHCRPDIPTTTHGDRLEPAEKTTTAYYSTECPGGCGTTIDPDDDINLTSSGWVCNGCAAGRDRHKRGRLVP